MSQGSIPDTFGNAINHSQEALTVEEVEGILGEFRSWVHENMISGGKDLVLASSEEEAIDLHTLLAQFLALRHEVNLQTKAVRAQQEQNAETLRQLTQALTTLGQTQAAHRQDDQGARNELLRPILKTLVDIYDALSLAVREALRVQESVLAALEKLPESKEPTLDQPTGLSRWFGRGVRVEDQAKSSEIRLQVQIQVQQFLDSLLTGYNMSIRRLERALQQYQLEPIPCVGFPFDPERMEAAEAVPNSGRPAMEVLDEVRRGYLWNGRVFRPAQVRVARG